MLQISVRDYRKESDIKSDKDTSKFLSLILRHKPEVIGISLDEHGYAVWGMGCNQ